MSRARTLALTGAGGLLLAVVLFVITVPRVYSLGCPIGNGEIGTAFVCDYGGTNWWTGEFRRASRTYTDVASGQTLTQDYWPDASWNYRAIPLPVGFMVGGLLTLGLIAAWDLQLKAKRTV